MQKYVYLFSEGNATMRNLLGGKGANLAEMTSLGMPVPQGFTITTEACTRYYDDGKTDRRRDRGADRRSACQDGRDQRQEVRRRRRTRCWSPCAPARALPCPA